MTLLQANTGGVYSIENIELEASATRRMQTLGMTKGTNITVVNKKRFGAVIIKVRGSRFALGRRFAEGVFLGGGNSGR